MWKRWTRASSGAVLLGRDQPTDQVECNRQRCCQHKLNEVPDKRPDQQPRRACQFREDPDACTKELRAPRRPPLDSLALEGLLRDAEVYCSALPQPDIDGLDRKVCDV